MDYLGEVLALAFDSILLGTCIKYYIRNKQAVAMIQDTSVVEVNKNLIETVKNHPNEKMPYIALRGIIKPIGNPIISSNNPSVQGVIQVMTIKEHIVQRSIAGFWSDQERTIQEVRNVVPFVINSRGYEVEVVDPLAADILDMDVISNTFHPTIPNVIDHIWGFFAGLRQRGIQTTEKMLRKGTLITGIGELIISGDENMLRLQPPESGAPFYLTTMQIPLLIKKLENSKKNYRMLCVVFSIIGVIISGLILRKYWKNRSRKINSGQKRREMSRKDTRTKTDDLPDSQLCVICKDKPRELILLPCGHVALCEDCASSITDLCPICRTYVERTCAAYLA